MISLGLSLSAVALAVKGSLYYSPLTASYTVATFTDITLSNTESFSFRVKGLDDSSTAQYILGSEDGVSAIYYRGSDGRLRLYDNTGTYVTVTATALSDGGSHLVVVRLKPTGVDFYVDDAEDPISATATITDITFSCIGAQYEAGGIPMTAGSVYGVTLGGYASWTMQSDALEFNGTDYINGNDLTFVDAPSIITADDVISTALIEDL